MILGPDGMAPTDAMRARQRKGEYLVMSIIALANIAVLLWSFWPSSKESYEDCQLRMAEKAKGNATIFLHLNSSVCQSLKRSSSDFLDK